METLMARGGELLQFPDGTTTERVTASEIFTHRSLRQRVRSSHLAVLASEYFASYVIG